MRTNKGAAGSARAAREAVTASAPGRRVASCNVKQNRVSKASGAAVASKRKSVSVNTGSRNTKTSSSAQAMDLEEAVQAELKKRQKRRKLISLMAVAAMVVGLGYFGFYYFTADRTASMYNTAGSLKRAGRAVPTFSINKTGEGEIPDILEEYSLLYSTHRNLIGWIKIEGTVIDYPVMKLNNEFYLDHNYNGDKDKNGAIFMDPDCDVLKPSTNLILYGHHMRSGNMFGGLSKYSQEDYGKAHSIIQFDSIYEKGEYQVMYVFQETLKDSAEITFKYYQFIEANSATEFESNMAAMEAMSMYSTGVKASFGDRLLTLSTCDNSANNGRFVVVAKRVA